MFKFIYDILTEPLGLPIEWYWEYIILAVIGVIAYHLAYDKVGNFYDDGLISGSGTGSFFHWIIRSFYFIVMWAVIYLMIAVGKFIIANWQLIALISACVLGTAIVCVIAIQTMRYFKKRRVSENG